MDVNRQAGKNAIGINLYGYNADFVNGLTLTDTEALIAKEILKEVRARLGFLISVGLDYLTLARKAGTLSGGEAQRVKLATELSKRATGRTVYVLDEPTTGLHSADVKKLIEVLQRLVDNGNTVIVIEHNLDLIKCADHIIDLGPEGGDGGGTIVAQGTPEEVAMAEGSYTGKYLRGKLAVNPRRITFPGRDDRLEVMESTAHSIINASAIGNIVHISKEEIDDLKAAFHLKD